MDALEILKQMHVAAKSTFQQIEQARPDQRGSLWAKLQPELMAHEQMEEQFVYDPAVRDAGGRDPRLAEFHQRHEQEVQQATRMMDEIGRLDARDSHFLDKVKALHQALAQHIEMEESSFWPQIRQDWGAEKLDQAARPVQAAKAAAEAGASASGALGAGREAVRSSGD